MTWTARHVETWLVEAAETLLMLPPDRGPRMYGNSMPDPVKDRYAYGYHPSRYIRRPSPSAIDRMMKVWEWLAHVPETERRLLYGWAHVKARRGARLSDFAQNAGYKSRTLRMVVSRLCQRIADRLNGQPEQQQMIGNVDEIAGTLLRGNLTDADQPRRRRNPTYQRELPSRLTHDASPENMAVIQKEIERLNRRARKRRKRRK